MPSASFSSRERRGIVVLLALMLIVLGLGLLPSTFLSTTTKVDPRPLYQLILEEQDKLALPDTAPASGHRSEKHPKHPKDKTGSGSKSRKKPRDRKADPYKKKNPQPTHDPFAPVPASQP